MNKIVSLTVAQYRLLGRAIRGAKLPKSRYQPGHATVSALARKNCWHAEHGHWVPTAFGCKVFNARGIWRPGTTVWDSASHEEREAARRIAAFPVRATKRDQEMLDRLNGRMREAGELS